MTSISRFVPRLLSEGNSVFMAPSLAFLHCKTGMYTREVKVTVSGSCSRQTGMLIKSVFTVQDVRTLGQQNCRTLKRLHRHLLDSHVCRVIVPEMLGHTLINLQYPPQFVKSARTPSFSGGVDLFVSVFFNICVVSTGWQDPNPMDCS